MGLSQANSGPYRPYKIDFSKRYANALAFAINPINPACGELPHSRSYGQPPIGSAVPTWSPSYIYYAGRWVLGQLMTSAAVTGICFSGAAPPIVTSDGAYSGDFSIMALAKYATSGSYGRSINQTNGNVNASLFELITNQIHTGSASGRIMFYHCVDGINIAGYVESSTNTAVDGNTHCWTARRQGGVYALYRDGINVTGNTLNNTGTVSYSGGRLGLGEAFGRSENNCAPGVLALTAGWNRALSDGEMQELGRNPFLMFEEPSCIWPFSYTTDQALGPSFLVNQNIIGLSISPIVSNNNLVITRRRPYYDPSVTFASPSLQGLANNAQVFWSSAVVDNSVNLYDDEIVSWVIKSGAPTAGLNVECWLWEIMDDAPTYPDVLTGSEGAFTLTSVNVKRSGAFKHAGSIIMDAVPGRLYYCTQRLSKVFGYAPKKWGAGLCNVSGASLYPNGNIVSHTPVKFIDI